MIISPATVTQYRYLMFSMALASVVLCMFCSLFFGAVSLSPSEIISSYWSGEESRAQIIIEGLRLPRTLLAACVGALLACCGSVTQGLFRNPLADPSLIGVTAGASVGASCVIVFLNHFEWSFGGLSLVTLGAFFGSLIAVVFVYKLATGPSGTSVATMLLAGIAVTYMAGSLSNLFEFLADNEMLRRISLWRMGGLDASDYTRVWIVLAITVAILFILPRHHAALNALLLGESEARHLGIDIAHVKRVVIISVAAGVGTSVALAGTISFVGLVVPHIVRILIGPNHKYLIPMSACMGAALLVVADTFARTIISPTELPVGLVTSMVGAPIFVFLLRKRHQYGMQ